MITKEIVRPLILLAAVLAASSVMFVVLWVHRTFVHSKDSLAYPSNISGAPNQDKFNNMDIMSVAVEAYLTANNRLPTTIDELKEYLPDERGHYSKTGIRRGLVSKYYFEWPTAQHFKSKRDLLSHLPDLADGSVVYATIEKPRTYAILCGVPNQQRPYICYPHNGFDADELFQRRREAALTKDGSSIY